MQKETADRVVSVMILAVSVAALGLVAMRQFEGDNSSNETRERTVTRIENWTGRVAGIARPVESVQGTPATVTIFTDFECPFCRRLDSLLLSYSRQHPETFRTQIVHLPLPMHANAQQSAQGFECALEQGKGEPFLRSLFDHQAVLGQVSLDSIATASRTTLPEFQSCMNGAPHKSIEAGVQLARALGINVTATVVINDWLITPADPEFVLRSIEAVVAGKTPKP